MLRFDKNNIKELKEYLYYNCVHDSKIENIVYECSEDNIKVILFNPIFNVKIGLTFHNISVVFAVNNRQYGNRETLSSLTVEEDFSYLYKYIKNDNELVYDSLYLLFQMFSGDELHIVCEEMFVDITK